MIKRKALLSEIRDKINRYKVTVLLGPRQCGKTTITKEIADETEAEYFDLEDPDCPLQEERAKIVLERYNNLVIIDEIQLQPSLFSLLRVLSDRRNHPSRFLILGSASPSIIKNVSESLAGRAAFIEMGGFTIDEIGEDSERLWIRGGLPLSYLAESDSFSFEWRKYFIKTFLERDIPQLGIRVPAQRLRRFWTMLAHYHGNIWNAAEIARSLGTKEDSARHYLDILTGTYLIRQLQPWFVNTGKRLVKSPKIYFRDTGLLHFLLGADSFNSLLSNPKLGLSWEGWCMEQIIHILKAEDNSYFYAAHSGSELDLLIRINGKNYGFEFKYIDSPKVTKSMNIVINDLDLEMIFVVYPGKNRSFLKEKIRLIPENDIKILPRILTGPVYP